MTDDSDGRIRDRPFPLRSFIDFDLDLNEPGHATASVVVTDAHFNPNGVVHGGVVFTMADTAMGLATMSVLPESQLCASIEVQVRFLRPISTGELAVDARILRQGRRVIHLEARAADGEGTLIALATGSFAVLPGAGVPALGSD